ncbi:hypothetical protein FOXG_19506 [Fusarium oxysporum f. sp. lycopersici 4287]|uniref:Uncharacterized protein n=2 Tax=Fusarium oxysporum TaxID=5507 RepID=A0A0J9V311_FUSO4|nr:hypothetical protein FOXG_19506 [Fusarium oxysporum f. sp. lycopersici 4287]EXK46046.1 hypothetical protein FOMG_04272 [Fusarium oxysporum f. sp. melonis 26406]KAJ9426210.1 hypothetical protein QL093DRAFT_2572675 [Fusarium oxysporum]KNB05221.1 hypothetical protein FOXG_19506 [Fusarium oxysporum f. sp. lycopersici 4287]
MSSPTDCSWPDDSLAEDATAYIPDINKDESVPHLDYDPPIAAARFKAFSEPWPGDNPTSSQRTEYVNAYLAWARHDDPALQVAVRSQARARIITALPMIKAKDWTEAETEHLLYLIDEEYWRLWLEDVDPKPLWPWTHPEPVFVTFNESSRCFIHRPLQPPNPRELRIAHHPGCHLVTIYPARMMAIFTMQR